MTFEFKLPDVGEGITEGEIVKWLVKEGDEVKADQELVQVETDKAVVDLPAPRSGTIVKINYKEGQRVTVGATLVVIAEKGESVATVATKVSPSLPSEPPRGKSVVGQLEEAPDEEPVVTMPQVSTMRQPSQTQKVLAAPAVRKAAAEAGIDLTRIKGSGEGGRIVMKDLPNDTRTVPQQQLNVKKTFADEGYSERVPLKGIRKTIATNMTNIAHTAYVTAMEDIDVSTLWALREKEKKNFEKKGIKLTLLPFIMKSCIAALKQYPYFNAYLDGEEIVVKKFYNIGIAVETDVGLVVPNIRQADEKTIPEIASEIMQLAEKARERKITLEEMSNGTFTITNYGSIGGTYATPIINPGESSILGVGRLFERVVLDKKGKPSTIMILPLSLTFDHRIIDGAQAARFLNTLKLFLEDPQHLVFELH